MWVNAAITPLYKAFMPLFVVSRSQGSSMGWNPSNKRKELFNKRSRFIIARKPVEPEDLDQECAPESQAAASLAAFGVFRFDTEHDEEGEDEEVIYWSVRAFLVPFPLNDTIPSYEVQVSTHAQRKGLGMGILELMKQYGIKYKMRKIVLTCLKGIVHCS